MAGTSKSRTAGLLAALKKPDVASSDSSAESDNGSDDSDDNLSTHRSALKPALDLTHTRSPEISLKPHSTIPFAETANDEESDDEAAYQAMKRRLLGPAKPSAPIQSTESVPRQQEAQPTAISSDEDDDMPVRAHQRVSNAKNTSNSVLCSPAGSVRSRHSSPGLFVTPSPSPAKRSSRASPGASSGADESKARKATKFQERVRRIREERLAREKEEQTQQEQQKSATKAIRRRLQQDGDDESDGENGRRLTQQAKPTRKAGKKALEAMARDQQRISRNMQLTHQAKTKKKHTVKDLFSRFGFDAPGMDITVSEPVDVAQPSSAPGSSDVDANELKDTPPTSPPSAVEETEKEITSQIETPVEPARLDKGKGRAPEFAHLPPRPWETQAEAVTMQHAQLQTQAPADIAMIDLSDSEDETTKPKSRFPVFDRLPLKKQEQSSSLLHLRHLAHLTGSDYARKGPKSVSLAEMQFSLAQKAREQAHKEREEKIAELKRRGIHIETEEEREKNQAEIEDMVAQLEKQRQEDRKLAKLEMEEAKKNGQTIDDLPSSDESDGDFVGSDEEDADEAEDEDEGEEADLELSGSEDEGEGQNNGEDVDIQNGTEPVTVVDTAAHSDTEGDAAPSATKPQSLEDADMEDIDTIAPIRKSNVVRNRKVVVDDDDDDELEVEEAQTCSPTQPATQDNAMAAFGFGGAQTSLGLTQMFAGTMANLESDSQAERTTTYETEQNSLDFLRSLPDTQPGANFSQTSDFLVPNSQTLKSPQKMSQVGPESQFSLGISQLVKTSPAFSRTQVELEDFPEPTQDAGFSFSRSPVGLKPPPPSTVDTVMLAALESPVKQRKGKLQRGRKDAVTELSDVDDEVIAEPEADFSDEDDIQRPPKPRDAFAKLARGAKKTKAMDDFNKKTSMAKGAVMEQAEESEDEYAGIGGASDDESGEEDEEINKMIDHGEVDVDERQLAAFYADKTKREDEKSFNELYKNVMNGGLRRRAAGRGGFDMDDSEDEDEIRLRKKRAEFQKMSRALLADERIGDIAKDQKKQAFFHTLADFADEGEYDFLDQPAELGIEAETSQSQEANVGEDQDFTIPDSQIADGADVADAVNPLKRKSPSNSQKENRPPPHLRRTAAKDNFSRKPITLADVQHSVSELLDDPRIIVPDSQYSDSDSDGESPAPNTAARQPIIDRLSLSRTSTASEGGADAGNMAFHAPSRTGNAPGFRVPSLIRQATSNLSTTSESRKSSGASTPTESVRRGGTGKSNIHAQAREAERRHLLEKKDSRRKEALKKKASAGRKAGMRSILGDIGGGFE